MAKGLFHFDQAKMGEPPRKTKTTIGFLVFRGFRGSAGLRRGELASWPRTSSRKPDQPESGRPFAASDGRHMQIDHPANGNEFVATKKSKKALAPSGTTPVWQKWKAEHPAPTNLPAGASTTASPTAAARSPASAPVERKPWVKQAPGTKLRARLTSITGSGNWKVELVEWQAGGVVFGKAPTGTYLNDVVELVLSDGGNAKDLRLRWG